MLIPNHIILEKAALTMLISGVSHGCHKGKVRELKLDILVDFGVLVTNIIMRTNKTLVCYKCS